LRSCMALATFFDAALLYFRAMIPPQWIVRRCHSCQVGGQ
jgi:hypothetical protein